MTAKSPPTPILLSIDLQNGLVEGPASWGSRSTPNLETKVTNLLSTWRSKNWPVIHVQHDDIHDTTNPISASHPSTFAIHSCAQPFKDEPIFIKHVGSPFIASGLKAKIEALEEEGKRKIVIIGMDAAQCINDTTRNGLDLGFEIVVVGDATAAYGMQDWMTGDQISAEDTHRAAMSMLAGYTTITTTEKVLGVLGY